MVSLRLRALLRWAAIVFASLVLLAGIYVYWYFNRPLPRETREQFFQGVTYTRSVSRTPRALVVHTASIALDTEGLRFLVTPKAPLEGRELTAQTTTEFAQSTGVDLAINGAFFDPFYSNSILSYYPHSGDPVDILGYAASEGDVYGKPSTWSPILNITKDNRAAIEATVTNIWNAMSGYWLIQNGVVNSDLRSVSAPSEFHPRTALGLDRSGKTLLLAVIDGRQSNYSEGATTHELGEVLLKAGAWTAMLVDGGGSSAMVVRDRKGALHLLNSPIHGRHPPGLERPIANHLGLFARPVSTNAAKDGVYALKRADLETRVESLQPILGASPAPHVETPRANLGIAALDGQWRYRQGDDPTYATAAFDDRDWATGTIEQGTKSSTTVWFRLHLQVTPELRNRSFAFLLAHCGDADVYLDGALLLRAGVPENKFADGNTALDLGPEPREVVFTEDEHVLAVRLRSPSQSRLTSLGLKPGFRAFIADYERWYQPLQEMRGDVSSVRHFFTGAALFLAVLHVFLFGLVRDRVENLYFAFFVMGGVWIHQCLFWLTETTSIDDLALQLHVLKLAIIVTAGALALVVLHTIAKRNVAMLKLGRAAAGLLMIVALAFAAMIDVERLQQLSLIPFVQSSLSIYPFSIWMLVGSMVVAQHFAGINKPKLQRALEDLANVHTELHTAQSQLVQSEKMAALGMLVAGIAHEINTPVGAIRSVHDSLSRALEKLRVALRESKHEPLIEDPKVIASLKVIEDAAKVIDTGSGRVTEIVKRLRSFARLDEAELKKVDIHEGLDDTMVLLQHELKHGVKVEKEYGALPPIACFPGQLNQVFLNVLVNARQAVGQDGTIRIKTGVEDGRAVVRIKDSGVGIPPDNLRRIFDPGFTTKGVGVGTGLGLSICYQIVQKHGGEIKVESEVGKGTEFIIILPMDLDATPPPTTDR